MCFFFVQAQSVHLSNWPAHQLKQANTALNEEYLTIEEKNVFFILNLARINPNLFFETILKNYQMPEGFSDKSISNNRYIRSLSNTLKRMDPVGLLFPDKVLYEYAKCHAISSGKRGFVGHRRRGCKEPELYSECCSYGFQNAVDIVVQLLIDYQISNLGHRKIMLDSKYKLLGVSIQPHTKYSHNSVLDFAY